ncbi:hypothetical protein [Oleomonas cavernae]|uniref:hypothetical protein n=1 Tax=Oleomonas cavernae TaxID=2320859 RepID=UPI001313FC66|nr:hypothetical protein [Oleomonas cavernae]
MAEAPLLDGRRQRAVDNRRRIVEAMLALVRAGDVAPGAEAVAAKAGVGLRTVFRLFEDMDSLYREIHSILYAELAPLVATPCPRPGPTGSSRSSTAACAWWRS